MGVYACIQWSHEQHLDSPADQHPPTTLQEDYVILDTINQPEGGKDVYAASLAIEMTDQWAYSMDPWTAP